MDSPILFKAAARQSFAGLELKDYITLLFNAAGEVVAAYPKSSVNADMKGIVTDVQGRQGDGFLCKRTDDA